MTAPLIPHNELVARAWLIAAVPRLIAGNVATTLPDPPWANNEFVQIMQVGGDGDRDNPIESPVVSLNCFAMKPNSRQVPWGQAESLAQDIWIQTFQIRYAPDPAVALDLGSLYSTPLCRTVQAVSLPRRIPSDPSQYAVYNLDVLFDWVPAEVVIPR